MRLPVCRAKVVRLEVALIESQKALLKAEERAQEARQNELHLLQQIGHPAADGPQVSISLRFLYLRHWFRHH